MSEQKIAILEDCVSQRESCVTTDCVATFTTWKLPTMSEWVWILSEGTDQ